MKKTKIIFTKNQLTVIERTNVIIFRYSDIVCILCERPYVMIVTYSRKRKLIFHSLKDIVQSLPSSFVICSRSAIVNLVHVLQSKTEKSNCFVYLHNELKIPVSRRKKSEIIEKIKDFSTFQ